MTRHMFKAFVACGAAMVAILLVSGSVLAAPAPDIVHTLSQPSGISFEARQWGDEWLHGWETVDGYTIMQDEATEYWHYARQSSTGAIEPSGLSVGIESPIASLEVHIRPDSSKIRKADVRDPNADASVVRPSGTANVPVILIEFKDRAHTHQASDFEDLLFGDHPSIATGPGSFKDYYREVSYGRFTVSSGPAGVQGWFTSSQNHDYYGRNIGMERGAALVREAILAADPYIDFSDYATSGVVPTVMIVHQGQGAEESGNRSDIWSHQWSLLGAGVGVVYADGVWIDSYAIQPERTATGMTTMGVFAHEFGHALGLPDLYDTDSSSEGVGDWCLMAGGNWNRTSQPGDTPAHMSAWCKWRLGWVNPVLLNRGQRDWHFGAAAYSDNVALLLPNPGGPADWTWGNGGSGEYFLVENRFRTGFDAGLPGSGLAIWHVDESKTDNNDEQHKLVDLEEADGRNDLDHKKNRGDAGDLYPGSTNNRSFSFFDYPDSRWYDERSTGVSVSNIGDAGSDMAADLLCRYAVTGASYDDMGLVLRAQGSDYFDIRKDYNKLEDPNLLSVFGTVLINCTDDLTVTARMASTLRSFVSNGGELYVSDWAYPVITSAFPGQIEFLGADPRIGVAGQTVAANPQDPALARYMGSDPITLQLDLGYWAVMKSAAQEGGVMLRGDVQVDATNPPRFSGASHASVVQATPRSVEVLQNRPLVASFTYGNGAVVYSSIHYSAQLVANAPTNSGEALGLSHSTAANSAMERLELWNLLATTTGREANDAKGAIEARKFAVVDKIIDSAASGNEMEYEIRHATGGALVLTAASESGPIMISLCRPDGVIASSGRARGDGQETLVLEVPDAACGTWTVRVRPVNSGETSAAFVICIGAKAGDPPDPSVSEVRFGPNPAGSALNVYYSLTCDSTLTVYDITGRSVFTCALPAIGNHVAWDLTSSGGSPLANGLYLCIVSNSGGFVGQVFRLLVQR
ncbi:MAG: M6 family metalloprotease domain-containing protein [Clostridia bacterium]|nr:M6 family metalloprotease domain-containing protein [Clostridia bacterium]